MVNPRIFLWNKCMEDTKYIKEEYLNVKERILMDVKRVKQILSSSSKINVTYFGVPVWIESCNETNGIVNVHDLQSPDETVQVDVTALEEQ